MNTPKPNPPASAHGTDRLLGETFRAAYSPQSEHRPEAFRQRVMQFLPGRPRAGRPLLARLAAVLHWMSDSPLWIWTGLLLCLLLRWRQALSLLLRFMEGDLPLFSSQVLVPACFLLAILGFLLREMILDQEEQMRW